MRQTPMQLRLISSLMRLLTVVKEKQSLNLFAQKILHNFLIETLEAGPSSSIQNLE